MRKGLVFLSRRHHGGGKQVLGPSVSQDSAPANCHMQKFWTHRVLAPQETSETLESC